MHVGSSQIQRPGDIIEGRHQHPVSMLFPQGLTDTGNLVVSRLSGILHRKYLYRILWNRRTALPDLRQRIKIGPERETALFAQVANEFLHAAGTTAPAVDTDFH